MSVVRGAARVLLPFALVLTCHTSAAVAEPLELPWTSLTQPCGGDCSFMVFGGQQVETGMARILYKEGILPHDWDYGDSYFAGLNVSRRIATVFDIIDIEAEVGVGQRVGDLDEAEIWGALYARYSRFPWNSVVRTTFGVSTGLNFATGVAQAENERTPDGSGDRLLHYLAPEITFSLPKHPETELVFRFHHRSGAMGFVSETQGGIQFATVGVRRRF